MAISNGNTITASDLNTAFDEHISTLKTENKRSAGALQINFDFQGVTSLDSTFKSFDWVCPDDYEVIDVGARVVTDVTGDTWSFSISGNLIESISLSGVVSSSPTDLTRYDDGSKPLQILLKGAVYTVNMETSGGSTNSALKGFILVKVLPRRS